MSSLEAVDLTVVVPTRDRPDLVRALPERLARCRADGLKAELVVVDDGSSEPVAEILANATAFSAPVRVLRQGRWGPARARNLGARHARGELLLFFADDLEPEPGWLLAHWAAHQAGKTDVYVARALLGPIEPPRGGGDTPFDRFVWSAGIHFDVATIAAESARPDGVGFQHLYASNLSMPRAVLIEVGGFDPGFPMAAWEDVELGFRLNARGVRIGFEASARVHALPGTGSALAGYLRWREHALPSAYRAMRLAPPLEDLVGRPTNPRWRGARHRLLGSAIAFLSAMDHVGIPLPASAYRRLLSHYHPIRTPPPGAETPIRAGRYVRDPVTGRVRFDSHRSDSVMAGELLLETLRPFRQRLTGRVLDLGCGDGPLRAPLELACDGYLGVDRSPNASVASMRADAVALPLRSACVDGVVIAEVLEHVRDPWRVLAEVHRVSRPEARVLVTAPFFYRVHDAPDDRWRFTEDGLVLMLREAGFRVEEVRAVGGVGSVLADLLCRNLFVLPGVAVLRLGRALGFSSLERLGGALVHRLSVVTQRACLVLRSVALALATRRGQVNRLTRWIWDRSSRMAKGYVVLAYKPADP